MDKVLRRAALAKRAAERKLAVKNAKAARHRMGMARAEHLQWQRSVAADRKGSRLEEKEDWRLGPLAPKRAVGEREIEAYGAMEQNRLIPPPVPRELRIKRWNIVPKDRVVVLEGPDRHKIGTVKSIDKTNNTLIVEKLNMAGMKVPDVFLKLDPNQPSVLYREMPIHYEHVRLVAPIPDPETGEPRDTIIANIGMGFIERDRRLGTEVWDRFPAGSPENVIPWPAEDPVEHVDQEADTRILDVETSTFTPGLKDPPFPVMIMDELRNKYGKFRTRHEPEFVEKVEAMERKRQNVEAFGFRTPLQEHNRRERQERKARGPPAMTEDVAEKIGRVMAERRPELLKKLAVKQA